MGFTLLSYILKLDTNNYYIIVTIVKITKWFSPSCS